MTDITIGSVSVGTQFKYQGCAGIFVKVKDSDGKSCKCMNLRTGLRFTIPNVSKITQILANPTSTIANLL